MLTNESSMLEFLKMLMGKIKVMNIILQAFRFTLRVFRIEDAEVLLERPWPAALEREQSQRPLWELSLLVSISLVKLSTGLGYNSELRVPELGGVTPLL